MEAALADKSRKVHTGEVHIILVGAEVDAFQVGGILDLGTGKITGNGGSIVIDEDLLSKIAFIKEGEFVETKGKPAIRLIGDIENVSTGKIVVRETTRKVVKAIEPNDLIKAFLKGINVEDPMEYIRAVCSATTGNYPIYFLLQQGNASINDAIKTVEDTTARGVFEND